MKTDEFYEIFKPWKICDHTTPDFKGNMFVMLCGKCKKCGNEIKP